MGNSKIENETRKKFEAKTSGRILKHSTMPCEMKHLMWVQVLITSQQLYSDKFVPFKADFRTIFITSGMRDSLKYPAEESPS